MLTAIAAASCIFLSSMLSSGGQSNGPKIIIFMSMVFFVLANSYYCGVLTMFFTYPASQLFETERDVMQAYPEWKLLFLKGWEENVYHFARQGIQGSN